MYGRQEMVSQLLKAGADPKAASEPKSLPIHWAAANGEDGIVSQLVKAGSPLDLLCDSPGGRSLTLAARNRHKSTVLLLIELGADPLLSGGENICAAVISGSIDLIRLFLEKEADPLAVLSVEAFSNQTETPLSRAAEEGQTNSVEIMLEYIDEKKRKKALEDAFFKACSWGHFDLIRVLVENHQMDTKMIFDGGRTPLHLVIGYEKPAMVELLLKNGVDPNAESEEGYGRPLGRAIDYDSPEVIILLLKHGAKATEYDKDALSRMPNHEEFLRFLK
jgi:ankyrin repeat protein